jgi:hypothetical protein
MLHPRIASALNHELHSRLRIEVDDVVQPDGSGQVNLTTLARRMQSALDALESVSAEELSRRNTSEESGFRIVWHARERIAGEESDPVIV